MDLRQHYLENARFEFQRMKALAERAMEQIRAHGARSYPATARPCFVSHRPDRLPRPPRKRRHRMAEPEHPQKPIGRRNRTLQEALTS